MPALGTLHPSASPSLYWPRFGGAFSCRAGWRVNASVAAHLGYGQNVKIIPAVITDEHNFITGP